MNNNARYLKYKEAMKYLDINSYITLNRMIDNGLPVIQVGNIKRIDKLALDQYMRDNVNQERA
ncbi:MULTISPECIES: DNA-binding protein [Apilactobacillus]|uniref:DNA-binding protein n=1 Tax=Apilactobacillus TaxID=2767877 RepID=UPI00200A05E5|nr:DNA-binding protein [Apilactobacillus ozensis]MCK8606987.1 DNA-binding protein [Apilactobacillus ozensis]